MQQSLAQPRTPFTGCKLSLHLNGLNVLTLEESDLIQAVLSFIGQNENNTIGGGKMRQMNESNTLNAGEAKHVKIVVFDNQNRVLTVKSKNRFILPGGRVEWDDDDAEAAARREVFETANIALGLVKPVTVIKTKDRQNQSAQTIVFVGRLRGEDTKLSEKSRFMSKEAFLETADRQSDLVRSLVVSAHRVLVSEEIRDEHDETAMTGREKYNLHSLI
ncbi:MAG: NUDIX domain-containing protein [Alphaproteobacteria bacterium]|nr:NUDIX domain-containing protein [Alphaproteobacteria bacterium]